MYAVKQIGVHCLLQPHRRSVSRKPHNQLGRNSVGKQTDVTVDSSGDTGVHKPNRGVTVSLPWIQGMFLLIYLLYVSIVVHSYLTLQFYNKRLLHTQPYNIL